MPSKVYRSPQEPGRLYDQAPIGLCALDARLRYLRINQWLADLNGLPVEAHLGRTIHEVLPEVAAEVEKQLRSVLETGQPIIGSRVDVETPAQPGVTRSFLHNYSPYRADDGQILGVNCVVTETTHCVRPSVFACGELSVNLDRREVRLGEHLVQLTPLEYAVLIFMFEYAHKVITHEVLLAAIWGSHAIERVHYLRVLVTRLRRKLERQPASPRVILTVQGIGYRFEC